MGNEKSRNHDTKGGNDGASKHQGKPKDQTDAKTGSGEDSQGGEAKAKGDAGE
jgi:hypothetical protein